MENPAFPEPPTKEKGYWGNLTPEQEQALKTVKENLKEVITEHYDDARLLRFLRARAFDIPAAEFMLKEDIAWRKENDVDNILQTFPKTPMGKQLLEEYPVLFAHKTDKYGLPLAIERITAIDPKSLFNGVPSEDLVKLRIYIMESLESMIAEASKKAGRPVDFGLICVLDVTELGWRHMYTPALNTVKKCLTNDKNHYPELLRKLLIVGCPRIFGMFWTIFKPILDARTVEKTEIHTGSGFHEYLQKQMTISDIPDHYGGKCNNPDHQPNCWTYGCKVWKSDKRGSVNENQYIDVNVKARSHHEVICNIDKPKTSIALEFKVENHDVKFKLLKQNGPKDFEEVVKETEVSHSEPFQTTVVVEEPGTYVLHWDNTFSKLRSKQVSYLLELIQPDEEKEISNEN